MRDRNNALVNMHTGMLRSTCQSAGSALRTAHRDILLQIFVAAALLTTEALLQEPNLQQSRRRQQADEFFTNHAQRAAQAKKRPFSCLKAFTRASRLAPGDEGNPPQAMQSFLVSSPAQSSSRTQQAQALFITARSSARIGRHEFSTGRIVRAAGKKHHEPAQAAGLRLPSGSAGPERWLVASPARTLQPLIRRSQCHGMRPAGMPACRARIAGKVAALSCIRKLHTRSSAALPRYIGKLRWQRKARIQKSCRVCSN